MTEEQIREAGYKGGHKLIMETLKADNEAKDIEIKRRDTIICNFVGYLFDNGDGCLEQTLFEDIGMDEDEIEFYQNECLKCKEAFDNLYDITSAMGITNEAHKILLNIINGEVRGYKSDPVLPIGTDDCGREGFELFAEVALNKELTRTDLINALEKRNVYNCLVDLVATKLKDITKDFERDLKLKKTFENEVER